MNKKLSPSPFLEMVTGQAASGKRAYLKEKIRNLIKSGYKPRDMLVLANSKNSAKNIRDDIMAVMDSFSELWVESATSFCKKVVRENYHYLNIKPNFKVISDFEKRLFIRNILKRDIDLKFLNASKSKEGLIREVSNFIDIAKRNPGWENNVKLAKGEVRLKFEDLMLITNTYQHTLEKFNYMDFVDLTLLTRKLFQNNPELIRFKALFVYETEDLDAIMGDIIELILKRVDESVISINPDLSIFSFRGAMPEYIMKKLISNFKFKEAKFVPVAEHQEFILETPTRDEQANAVAAHIAGKIKKGINPKDIVIISRSVGENLQVFMDALRKRGINYMLVGGIGFFRQPEIIEFMSLLNCIYENRDTDDNHLYRTLKLTGILTDDQIDMLRRNSVLTGKPLVYILDQKFKEESGKFWKIVEEIRRKSKKIEISRLIYDLFAEFGFLKRAASDEFAADLYSYFYRIVEDFSGYYKNLAKRPLGFAEFMENLYDLLSGFGKELDIPYSTEEEAVKIMTVQQAKGNVFKLAYLVDMTEDNFPRPFYENPLLNTNDSKVLKFEPVQGMEAQYEFEKRLFNMAKTRGSDEIIYCWYNTGDDNAPRYISSFIKNEKFKSIKDEVFEDTVVDENDLFIKIIENVDRSSRDDLLIGVNSIINDRFNDINAITDFDEKELIDRVVKGIPGRFSNTYLKNFRECPEKFFIKHILKLQEPQNPNMLLGTAVHRILERIHSKNIFEQDKIRELIDEVWKGMDFYSCFESRNLYLIAVRIIENYIRVIENDSFDVITTEENFSFVFKDINLIGRLDRLDRLESGEERVVDYKTGRKSKMEKGLLGEVERGDNFQIPIYKWATNCRYFSIYWVRKEKGKMDATIDFDEEKSAKVLEKAEDNLIQTVKAIREGRFIPEGKNCRMCYYRRICNR